jgi:hypothetical protein
LKHIQPIEYTEAEFCDTLYLATSLHHHHHKKGFPMPAKQSTIVKDLSAAAAMLKGTISQAEQQHLDEIAAVKADLQPLADKAAAASEALQALLDAHDSYVAPFRRDPDNNWRHAGRMAMDYANLEAAIAKSDGAKKILAQLHGVPGEIIKIAHLVPSRRTQATQSISKSIAAWCEAPQQLTDKVLPSIAFYASKVAERERTHNYGQ